MAELTVKQAIEQGYEYFGCNEDGWQTPRTLADIEQDDFKRPLFLFCKDRILVAPKSAEDIAQEIIEDAAMEYVDTTGTDDDLSIEEDLIEAMKEISFKAIEDAIRAAYDKNGYYRLTDISLIP